MRVHGRPAHLRQELQHVWRIRQVANELAPVSGRARGRCDRSTQTRDASSRTEQNMDGAGKHCGDTACKVSAINGATDSRSSCVLSSSNSSSARSATNAARRRGSQRRLTYPSPRIDLDCLSLERAWCSLRKIASRATLTPSSDNTLNGAEYASPGNGTTPPSGPRLRAAWPGAPAVACWWTGKATG